MTAAARYKVMPEARALRDVRALPQHRLVCADGSVGKCDSCHTRHTFSAAEAEEPEACGTCHMGPDHEQIDMWQKSKHGVVYTTEKSRRGRRPGPRADLRHLPHADQEKPRRPAADPRRLDQHHIGTVAQGARLAGTRRCRCRCAPSRSDDFTAKRAKMIGDLRAVPRRELRDGATSRAPTRSRPTSTRCSGIP